MARTAATKVNVTKNYDLFHRSKENRSLDMRKHKRLEKSMLRYGFLQCFPVVCVRDAKRNLVVKDGQHRLAMARKLGLPVHWVEETVDFDVATINCTAKSWDIRDYAVKHAENGLADYREGLQFAESHGIPLSIAYMMLAGQCSWGNISTAFQDGKYKVRDREWAELVVGMYLPMIALTKDIKNKAFLDACMACCRVPGFDTARMIKNAHRCRDKLASFSTRDAYLAMLEDVYNFNVSARKIVGLKSEATRVMRLRNAVQRKPE